MNCSICGVAIDYGETSYSGARMCAHLHNDTREGETYAINLCESHFEDFLEWLLVDNLGVCDFILPDGVTELDDIREYYAARKTLKETVKRISDDENN